MTGKPVVRDSITRAIGSGRDLSIFANTGCFQEHHLRILVSMPRTPLSVIKMVAREPGTHPERAIDYCSSAVIARALLKICKNASCFAFYDQPVFAEEGATLHDQRKGADRFRSREIVYEVLCERILFAGDVLPYHVSSWFNNYGHTLTYTYIQRHGSEHMMACLEVYTRQFFRSAERLVYVKKPYDFMVTLHRYTKFLPLRMFFRAVFTKKETNEKFVGGLVDRGCSFEQIELEMVGKEDAAEPKKKKSRRSRAAKSPAVRYLLGVTEGMLALDCSHCQRMILAFL